MFVDNKDTRRARLEQQIVMLQASISEAKYRLLQKLQEDQTNDPQWAFGMVPGGRTSFSDFTHVAALIQQEAKLIDECREKIKQL